MATTSPVDAASRLARPRPKTKAPIKKEKCVVVPKPAYSAPNFMAALENRKRLIRDPDAIERAAQRYIDGRLFAALQTCGREMVSMMSVINQAFDLNARRRKKARAWLDPVDAHSAVVNRCVAPLYYRLWYVSSVLQPQLHHYRNECYVKELHRQELTQRLPFLSQRLTEAAELWKELQKDLDIRHSHSHPHFAVHHSLVKRTLSYAPTLLRAAVRGRQPGRLATELERVRAMPQVSDMAAEENMLLIWLKEPIVTEEVDFGKFVIVLAGPAEDPKAYSLTPLKPINPPTLTSWHPHVSNTNGYLCLGSKAWPMLLAAGELELYVEMADEALRNYDHGSVMAPITAWTKHYQPACRNCGADTSSHAAVTFELRNCQNSDCGANICTECGPMCAGCGERYCSGHSSKCVDCSKRRCTLCLYTIVVGSTKRLVCHGCRAVREKAKAEKARQEREAAALAAKKQKDLADAEAAARVAAAAAQTNRTQTQENAVEQQTQETPRARRPRRRTAAAASAARSRLPTGFEADDIDGPTGFA